MRDKFEYKTDILNGWIEPKLSEIGEDGWELVLILPLGSGQDKYLFKRKKLETENE